MSRRKLQRSFGFTLVELAVSLGIVGTLTMVGAQESKFELSQLKAQAMGNEIFQHNSAVSRYLSAHAGDPSAIGVSEGSDVVKIGSSWLKDSECAGSASSSFIPCLSLPDDVTTYGRYSPTTTIRLTANGTLEGRTAWHSGIESGGDVDTLAMGLASLVASGSAISQTSDAASGFQVPTVYCPGITDLGTSIATICGSDRNVIISSIGINNTVEPWLRTDHGNTMRHAIEFGVTPSSQSDINLVDDGSSGSGMRQIINVARIYNRGSSGDDSLILGKQLGNSLISSSFLSSHNLLNEAVIVDGDLGVINSLFVKVNAIIEGGVEVGEGVKAGSDIEAGGNLLASGQVRAQGHVIAESSNSDIIAGRDVLADRHVRSILDVMSGRDIYASNNIYSGSDIESGRDITSGRNLSVGNDLTVGNNARISNLVHARAMLDYTDPRVFSEGGYLLHMKGASRLSNLAIEKNLIANGRVKIKMQETEWASCTGSFSYGVGYDTSIEGSISMSVNGNLVVCKGGVWQPVGGTPSGTYAYFNRATCPTGWFAANGGNGTVDLRGEFIRGWDNGRGVDTDTGASNSGARALGSWQKGSLNTFDPTYDSFGISGIIGRANWDRHNFSHRVGYDYISDANVKGLYPDSRMTRISSGATPDHHYSAGWSVGVTRPRNVSLLACMKS